MEITVVGDSFSKGYLVYNNYTRLLQKAGFDIVNISENGATSTELVKIYKKVKKYRGDILLIFAGVNDFYQNESVEFAYQNVKSILEISTYKKNMIILPPYVEEEEAYSPYKIINEKILAYDERLKELGDLYVDCRNIPGRYLDGLHMAEDFHKNLARKIIEILKEVDNA